MVGGFNVVADQCICTCAAYFFFFLFIFIFPSLHFLTLLKEIDTWDLGNSQMALKVVILVFIELEKISIENK